MVVHDTLIADETMPVKKIDTPTEISSQSSGAEDPSGIRDATIRIDSYVDQLKSNNDALHQQVKLLDDKVSEGVITTNQYRKEIESISVVLKNQETFLKKFRKDYKEYQANSRKYVFKTRAKKILPYLYGLAAMSFATGSAGDKALYALAGYGAGTLVENTGYGLAGASAFVGAKLKLFEVKF